jgi:hypothetical protein
MQDANPIKPKGARREEHADAANIATQLKELSASRATVEKATNLLTPMFPIDGDNEKEVEAADVLLEEVYKQQRRRTEEEKDNENSIYHFFVKCRNQHPEGQPSHGVYLTLNPETGLVRSDQWKSAYKPNPKSAWYEDILCQVCLRYYGQKVELPVVVGAGGSFTVDQRWLWRRPKDPKRASIEGESRANPMGLPSQNNGRDEANRRAAAAGYEVIP